MRHRHCRLPLLGLLSACSPWQPVVEREAVWWDAARIESEAGVSLIPVTGGAPVGHWPRIVLREDGIDLDNRAWALSLPQEVYAQLSDEEIAGLLIERPDLVPVTAGGVTEPTKGLMIPALYDAALESITIHRDLAARTDIAEPQGEVVIIPEPGVPSITVAQAIYSAGQGQLSSFALTGKEDGHLRYINRTGFDASQCAMQAALYLSAHPHIQISPLAPPIAAPGCADGDPAALLDALDALSRQCTSLWAAARQQTPLLSGRPDWACASLITIVSEDVPAETLLQTLSAVQGHAPAIQHYLFTVNRNAREPRCTETLDDIASLSLAQLSVLCDAEGFLAQQDRDHQRSLIPTRRCPTPTSQEAFPVWSDDFPGCPEEQP